MAATTKSSCYQNGKGLKLEGILMVHGSSVGSYEFYIIVELLCY